MERVGAAILSVALGAVMFPPGLGAQARPEFRTGYYHGRQVTYQVIDGLAIYQGDIILGKAAEIEADESTGSKAPADIKAAFTSLAARLWPNGVVPYVIDADLPNQSRITDAV